MTSPRHIALSTGYRLLFAATTLTCIGWLFGGAVITLVNNSIPATLALRSLAEQGSAMAKATLASATHGEPLGQAIADFAFSTLSLAMAAVLLARYRGCRVTRLLALGSIGSAGAFNLQAHAIVAPAQLITGWHDVGTLHQILLHDVSFVAFIVAMLIFPTGRLVPVFASRRANVGLLGAGIVATAGVGIGTLLLPHTVSCVLIFGVAVPLAGLAVLPHRMRDAPTTEQRTQARLAFSVLMASFGATAVLAVVSLALVGLKAPGMTLHDPTARMVGSPEGQPTTLLFWFARLAIPGIVTVLFEALRRNRLASAERICARGLAVLITSTVVGGGYLLVRTVAQRLVGGILPTGMIPSLAATVVAAGYLLPIYRRSEDMVDRVLYGRRPTPYRVLADVAALPGGSASQEPNLERAAEAIGRGLGAGFCRLSVLRPGLSERNYHWSARPDLAESLPGSPSSSAAPILSASGSSSEIDAVVVPITQGGERIGTIAVDPGAVAGLYTNRRTLLEDIAESLGPIVAASRTGIELERQLRAAVAHAEDIALSRRTAVAEMDSERRTIERDLHDGAQLHLVSLRVLLGVAEHELAGTCRDQADQRLEQLQRQLDDAERVLADTASGVSADMLAERGLAAALVADLADPDVPVTVAVRGLDEATIAPRISAPIEAAVYFCCLESVNNARKHAPGASVEVIVEVIGDKLALTVRDAGPGFGTEDELAEPKISPEDELAELGMGTAGGEPAGRGQRNLTTRINSVGGELTIHSTVGVGTTVLGTVPLLPAPEPDTVADPTGSPIQQARALFEVAAATYRDGSHRVELNALHAQLNTSDGLTRLPSVLGSLQRLAGPGELGTRIERVRVGLHELSEIELAKSLRGGEIPLSEADRVLAHRLLGGEGPSAAARLGIRADPTPEAVRQGAERQLTHWRRLSGHPATTRTVRDAATILTHICEQLLHTS